MCSARPRGARKRYPHVKTRPHARHKEGLRHVCVTLHVKTKVCALVCVIFCVLLLVCTSMLSWWYVFAVQIWIVFCWVKSKFSGSRYSNLTHRVVSAETGAQIWITFTNSHRCKFGYPQLHLLVVRVRFQSWCFVCLSFWLLNQTNWDYNWLRDSVCCNAIVFTVQIED